MENNEEKPIDFVPDYNILGQAKEEVRPSQMPLKKMEVNSLENISLAKNFDRFLAGIIDILFVSIILFVVDNLILSSYQGLERNGLMKYLSLFITCLYHGIFDSSKWQGTVGKKIIGIRISSADGSGISFLRSIMRYIISGFSMLILFLGYINIFRNKNKQSWHDILVGTYVTSDEANQVSKSKRRNRSYLLLVILLMINVLYFRELYNQAITIELKKKNKLEFENKKNDLINSIDSVEIASTDFIYKDTLQGFSICVKKGLRYFSIKNQEASLFMVCTDDSVHESISYMVQKGEAKKGVLPENFLKEYQKAPNFNISDIRVGQGKNGFLKEQANIIMLGQNNISNYGVIRVYIKGKLFFQIMVFYNSLERTIQETKLTEEILDSFEIL